MTEARNQPDLAPLSKAMRDAEEAAAKRLIRMVEVIEAQHLDPDSVLIRKRWCRPGKQSLLVLFAWPGVLLVQDPRTGEVLQQARASYMARSMPDAMAFLHSDRKAHALLTAKSSAPQGAPCKGVFDAWGVLTIRNAKTNEVLAKSQAGRPAILLPGFSPLNRRDLEPRWQ